jgi:fimbrial chaperone protein
MPILRALAPAVLALAWAADAQAFTFTPMSVSFDAAGPGSTRSFQVENDSDVSIAVEVSMAARQITLDGDEKQLKTPETDAKFLVYPPQLVLKPKEKRTVRVTWKGEPVVTTELPYRIVAEQLPVDTEKKKTNETAVIKMLLKYVGAVYITPAGATSEIHAQGAPHAGGAKGAKPKLALEIQNRGKAHEVLAPSKVRLKSGARSVELSETELNLVRGQNLLPGATRRVLLAWPKGFPPGPVQVSFEK